MSEEHILRNFCKLKAIKGKYPSVLSKIKLLDSYMRPKEIVTALEKEAGGPIEFSSPNDIPSNRMQVCNKLRQIPDRPKA